MRMSTVLEASDAISPTYTVKDEEQDYILHIAVKGGCKLKNDNHTMALNEEECVAVIMNLSRERNICEQENFERNQIRWVRTIYNNAGGRHLATIK